MVALNGKRGGLIMKNKREKIISIIKIKSGC